MQKGLLYGSISLLVIGIFPLPYGYYTFLRIVICGISIWIAKIFWEKNNILSITFIMSAVLFNPVIKIFLPKLTWTIIDIFLIGLLIFFREQIQQKEVLCVK